MLNITNFERQHKEIWEIFFSLEKVIHAKRLPENIDTLVINLNTLAGKLNMHMNLEDKLLYPELTKSNNEELKALAIQYSQEMGDISLKFNAFKTQFNTKNKITNNIDAFFIEGKEILKVLHNRLDKEDKYLYPKIKSL